MNINTIKSTVLADAADVGTCDPQSIMILAIGRVAQATLAAEILRMEADGASAEDVEAFSAERGAQLDRWIALQCEEARIRGVVRDELRSA